MKLGISCAGKSGFGSRALAEKAGRNIQGKMSVYLCPACHKWHVGHAPPQSAIGKRDLRKLMEEDDGREDFASD